MTKHRAPLSFDAALARIAGQVPGGFEALAIRSNRKERTVRNWGDPDTTEHVPIDIAVDLDLLFAEHGGDGSPFLEAFAHQREQLELVRHCDRIALGARAAELIKECGEAGSALVIASQPNASPRQRAMARAELTEAHEVIKHTLALLVDDKEVDTRTFLEPDPAVRPQPP